MRNLRFPAELDRREPNPLEGGQAMEARKEGAMRLGLGVTCCSFLILALLNSPIAADMGSPSHSCLKPKPYDSIELRSQSDLDMYNDSVNRYKLCIEEFVEEQNKAVNRHNEAIKEFVEEQNKAHNEAIKEFVEEQNKAINRNYEAAAAATEEYNSFVRAERK
jgi:gas vesicle protein